MAQAFAVYWRPDGWGAVGEGNLIRSAAGSGYSGRVQPGARVFVTNVKDGQLWVLGAFTVARVVVQGPEPKPDEASWDAPEYLVAEEGTSTPLRFTPVPQDAVRRLQFITLTGATTGVKLLPDGSVHPQAMRRFREVLPDSAQILERIVAGVEGGEWTDAELRASVEAYMLMAQRLRAGEPVVKKQVYRELSQRFGRSVGAFDYRMRNISFVLSAMGREWIPGLRPAVNAGTNVAPVLERLIQEFDGITGPLVVGEALAVRQARASAQQLPAGSKTPAKRIVSSTVVERDALVKAWVLNRANGSCEGCKQPAPFKAADGSPFLEVHHVRRLADGGSDTPANAVALCPNCHRRLHYAEDAHEHREALYVGVVDLVRE